MYRTLGKICAFDTEVLMANRQCLSCGKVRYEGFNQVTCSELFFPSNLCAFFILHGSCICIRRPVRKPVYLTETQCWCFSPVALKGVCTLDLCKC